MGSTDDMMIDILSRFLLVASRAEAIRKTLLISLIVAYVATIVTSHIVSLVLPHEQLHWREAQLAVPFFVGYIISVGFVTLFMFVSLRLNTVKKQLEELARIDSLTGLLNRRAFSTEVELRRMRGRTPARGDWVLLIDADRFKSVNDQYGHAAGDLVLSMIAVVLKGNVFERDLVARIGGEEFAVYLNDTDAKGVAIAAERIRAAISENTVYFESKRIKITVSIGCASVTETLDLTTALARADACLYRAKDEGRNRIVVRDVAAAGHASDGAQAQPQNPAIRLVSTS